MELSHGFAGVLEDAATQQSAEILQLEAGTMQLQAVVADNTRLQHDVTRLQRVQSHPFTMTLPSQGPHYSATCALMLWHQA